MGKLFCCPIHYIYLQNSSSSVSVGLLFYVLHFPSTTLICAIIFPCTAFVADIFKYKRLLFFLFDFYLNQNSSSAF